MRLRPNGQPNQPTEMIMSIVEAIYDDYAKANFTNYELRKEDLNQLAGVRAPVQGHPRISLAARA